MLPVAVFRFVPHEGPGTLAGVLDRAGVPWQLYALDGGAEVPGTAAEFSGLVLMGGPMSANDDLPWIPPLLDLIRDAVARGVPVLGHCLGGQLMSKALGGEVTRNPVKELGWGEVTVSAHSVARDWFGDAAIFPAFHWHGETFSLPPGSTHLLSSTHCANQAWALGPHLALQCHLEMTADMIAEWCEVGAEELEAAGGGVAVQSAAAMQQQAETDLPPLQALAERVYYHWLGGLLK